MNGPSRKSATILAADVVGYSRMMHADDLGTLAILKALWAEAVRPNLQRHGGRVFKMLGDGVLAEFAGIAEAGAAALAIQAAVLERHPEGADTQSVQLRIGLHNDTVLVEDVDLFGDGVNIASRLQELAPPGGIAVSEAVFSGLSEEIRTAFSAGSEYELKNIDEPVSVRFWPSAPERREQAPEVETRAARPSIAVMPFSNLSGNETQDFFADGMVEDVINALSKFGWLMVIARGTMLTYKNRSVSMTEVADELQVQYVLEGSVRQASDRVRVSVELSEVETGTQIWADRFDRDLSDLFAIQDEITSAIAAAITPEIGRAERSRAARTAPSEVNSWLLYQKAMGLIDVNSLDSLLEVIAICERVQTMEPGFAPAFALAARARVQIAQNHRPEDYSTLIDAAHQDTKTALALAPRDAVILAIASRVQFGIGRLDQAVAYAREAVALNPNSVDAHYALGLAYTVSGQTREALGMLEKAVAMSPLDPSMHYILYIQAMALFHLERNGSCADTAERAIALGTCPVWVNAVLAIAYGRLDLPELRDRALRDLYERKPEFSIAFTESGLRNVSPAFLDPFVAALRELGISEE